MKIGTDHEPMKGNGLPAAASDPRDKAIQAILDFCLPAKRTAADQAGLFRKRGLTEATCELAGVWSNERSNLDLLLKLRDSYDLDTLIEAGL